MYSQSTADLCFSRQCRQLHLIGTDTLLCSSDEFSCSHDCLQGQQGHIFHDTAWSAGKPKPHGQTHKYSQTSYLSPIRHDHMHLYSSPLTPILSPDLSKRLHPSFGAPDGPLPHGSSFVRKLYAIIDALISHTSTYTHLRAAISAAHMETHLSSAPSTAYASALHRAACGPKPAVQTSQYLQLRAGANQHASTS